MKKSLKIECYRDSSVSVGDLVRLIDGSALTNNNDEEVYIKQVYPSLTGSDKNLENLNAEVMEVNVSDYVCTGRSTAYMQDIVIKIGESLFRTCSGMVKVVQKRIIEQNTDFRGFEKTNCHTMHEAIELVKHFGLQNVKVRAVSGNGEILEEWDNFNRVLTQEKGN